MPDLELAISATTRERRPGEENGREYWFIPREEFDRRLAAREFIEHVDFPWGQSSGTLRSELDRISANGRIPLLDLEPEGALHIRDEVPGSVTVFVTAPSFDELERRLRERATESAGEIGDRLTLAREQLELAQEFDHLVVNDDLERATAELEEIVRGALSGTAARAKPARPPGGAAESAP